MRWILTALMFITTALGAQKPEKPEDVLKLIPKIIYSRVMNDSTLKNHAIVLSPSPVCLVDQKMDCVLPIDTSIAELNDLHNVSSNYVRSDTRYKGDVGRTFSMKTFQALKNSPVPVTLILISAAHFDPKEKRIIMQLGTVSVPAKCDSCAAILRVRHFNFFLDHFSEGFMIESQPVILKP